MLPNIQNFQNEVSTFYEKVREQLDPQKIFNDSYKGYFVFMSPIYETCEVMFIGINPGTGGDCKSESVEPQDYFDYLPNNYTLARETNKVFEQIGKKHILEGNVIKTNMHYLVTNNPTQIWENVNSLSDDLKTEFNENSKKWTKELVTTFNPKLIICEGVEAFDAFCKIYPPASVDISVKDCFDVIDENLDFKLIGYSRRFSNIRNKEGLGEIIKKYITQ